MAKFDEDFQDDSERPITDEFIVDEKPEPPVKPVRAAKSPPEVGRQLSDVETSNIMDYFRNLVGAAPVRMKIQRQQPQMYKGRQVAGLLDTIDELIDEDEIKSRYGGGKYIIQIQKQDPQGRYKYAGQRIIQIAGEPKLDGLFDDIKPVTPLTPVEDSGLTRSAMAMAERQAQAERQRADRLETEAREAMREASKGGGLDPQLMSMFQNMMASQADTASRRVEALERDLRETRTAKPENTLERSLAEKILTDDNARINSLREGHASEIRAIRENHQAELRSAKDNAREDLKRSEDRADRMLDAAEKSHTREIDLMRQGFTNQLESIRVANEARASVLESENRRLLKEVSDQKAELIALREKKDKPLTETIVELSQFSEAMKAFKGDDGGGDSTTFDKIMTVAGPIAEGLAGRLGQPQQQQMMPGQMMVPQFQGPGQPQQQRVARPKRPQQQAPRPVVSGTPPSPIKPEDIRMAVQFFEGAINADTPPEQFASTVQSMVDGNVIHAIKVSGGVDKFLENRVQLGVNSPLLTQKGRRFVRTVERLLGAVNPQPDAESPPETA